MGNPKQGRRGEINEEVPVREETIAGIIRILSLHPILKHVNQPKATFQLDKIVSFLPLGNAFIFKIQLKFLPNLAGHFT